jgi:hypothetical protein
MKKSLLGLIILASIFLAGCPVSDLHPLYKNGEDVVEPMLAGKWIPADSDSGDKGYISFEKATSGGYTMTVADTDLGVADQYDVRLVRLSGSLFADLHFSGRAHGGKNVDMPIGLIATHMVVKLTVAKDDLAWATMEDDALKNILKNDSALAKPLLGKMEYDSDDSLALADTETLRQYVTAHATDGFSAGDHWHRAK